MITKNATVALVDFDDDLNKKQILVTTISELPDTYLPAENSFFKEEEYHAYALELKNQFAQKENEQSKPVTTEQPKHWKINWQVDEYQIKLTIDFYNQHKDNVFVQRRNERNVQKIGRDFSREFVWKSLVSCLLTTQQKSGPKSSVAQFLHTAPFPLNLQFCMNNVAELDTIAETIFKNFGGLRRTIIIAQQLKDNLQTIIDNDWLILKEITCYKISVEDRYEEQRLANSIQKQVIGFGPKQSRNFLQILGITKYEIPIDSRITNWLNQNNFPIHLIASGLSDPYYYQFISDGIQYLCEKAKIYPCLLDAAIFSSYDKKQWTEENSVF